MAADLFFFDADSLRRLAEAHQDEFARGQPFPHAVFDDFLPDGVAARVLEEFPATDEIAWDVYRDRGNTEKLATTRPALIPPFTRHVLAEFNSAAIMEFLETLTGMTGLTPDPYFLGGGLHQIEPGGFLNVHADFNVHPRLKLDRRLNLLLYVNREWRDEWGGHLELWTADPKRCARRVAPLFNRCVVFATTDRALHGHPTPLKCPTGQTRKSLAFYYYSNGRPENEQSPTHTTLYGDAATERPPRTWRQRAKPFVPPIVLDTAKRLVR